MSLRYFILEMKSHAMDGFYARRDDATGVLLRMRELHPWGVWTLCELLEADPQGGATIPDEYFHVHRLRHLSLLADTMERARKK